jgi:hypothetical protein
VTAAVVILKTRVTKRTFFFLLLDAQQLRAATRLGRTGIHIKDDMSCSGTQDLRVEPLRGVWLIGFFLTSWGKP